MEVDRVSDGRILPHELILDSLRPSLRDAEKTTRTETPLRLFCQPFEDLLSNDQWGPKQKGRIPRSAITPVWNWFSQELAPDLASAFAIAVKTAVVSQRTEELGLRTEDFWKTAADRIATKIGSESGRRSARQFLGSDAMLDDAHEMALMLSAGTEICELQNEVPRALPSLSDATLLAYKEACQKLATKVPDCVPYVPLVVMRRLEHPWEAMRLPLGTPDENGQYAPSDSGLVADILFNAVEAHAAAILVAQPERFNANSLAGHVAGLVRLSNGIAKEIELRRDGVWGQRLVKDRAAVAETMTAFMQRAPEAIGAALPLRGDDIPERSNLPDLSQVADPEKADRALSYARLLTACRPFAAEGSFAAALKAADTQIGAGLKHYNEEIVRALRVTDEETRLNAEQYAAIATELTAILFSPDEGESIREQGREAIAGMLAA